MEVQEVIQILAEEGEGVSYLVDVAVDGRIIRR